MDRKNISKAVIQRLPRYYRYLGELLEEQTLRISSQELSERMHVTSSQIRQDLNQFGGFGQQGYGYNVEVLYHEIGKILGIDRKHNMIVVGAGNLAQAIANYTNFERRGFVIRALFDRDPKLIGRTFRDIPVYPMEQLEEFILAHDIHMAAICIPKGSAIPVAERLVSCGIKAIWNFAHTDLNVPEDVVVENVHLSESLMRLSYRLAQSDEKGQ
ncbi:MAG: redox-sensing transcriptional repressor Rex [Lachnospiraceae bacterium]|nr:redox-sensing transcriptional repressor Rex [Lachnospiraceae bacterium]